MDRKELADELERVMDGEMPKGSAFVLIGAETLKAMQDALASLEPQGERWIAVTDELPEEGRSVLCCWRNAAAAAIDSAIWSGDGCWLNPNDSHDEFRAPDYWRPLDSLLAALPALTPAKGSEHD